MSTTLQRITELYEEQLELQQRASTEWLTPAELATFREIRKELAELWPERRAELAGAPAGHLLDVVRTESTFHHKPRLPKPPLERAVGE